MNKSKPSKLSRRLTMQKLPINVLSLASSGKRVCSDDENKEPSVGGSSGTACNKRAYSDDDDSPVEPGQQTSLQSAMAGEMSKILDSFGNDVAKSLRAKKRRLWQHLRVSLSGQIKPLSYSFCPFSCLAFLDYFPKIISIIAYLSFLTTPSPKLFSSLF